MQTTTRRDAAEPAADLTVGDGLQEMLAGAVGALRSRSSAARYPAADAVHRFRVGLRRLRSILSAFADAFPEAERRALSDRLRAVAQRYGRAREWDVFLGECVAPLRQSMPDQEPLLPLERMARAARRAALPPGDTLRRSFIAIDEALTAAPWLRRPAPAQRDCWQTPLREHAASLLARRHRQLKKGLRAADLADQAAFHQLRIRVKKLRYPSELLKSLFDEALAKSYLRRLTELQDLMGQINDARVAGELMRALDVAEPVQHLVAGWLARQIAGGRENFPHCARAFRRAEPFWEG